MSKAEQIRKFLESAKSHVSAEQVQCWKKREAKPSK